MSQESSNATRRRWTAAEKAHLVRRHLRDGISVASLADEHGLAPSQIHGWIRVVLDRADQALVDKRQRENDHRKVAKELAGKDDRIRHLEEVTAELSMEVLQLKKGRGAT